VLGGPLLGLQLRAAHRVFRDGCCATHRRGRGGHLVCIKATASFSSSAARAANESLHAAPGDALSRVSSPGTAGAFTVATLVEARKAGRAPQGGPRVHSRKRPQVRPPRALKGHATRPALTLRLRPPAETICNESRPGGNSLEKTSRENARVASSKPFEGERPC